MIQIDTATVPEFFRSLLPTEPHFCSYDCIFRGQADASWPLVLSIRRASGWERLGGAERHGLTVVGDRVTSDEDDLKAIEMSLLYTLGQVVHRTGLPPHLGADAARLALAQHIGLPTGLLDWSRSPWVAAYFAASEVLKKGLGGGRMAVYGMSPMYRDLDDHMQAVEMVTTPTAGNMNMIAQQGLLTKVLKEPWDLLEGQAGKVDQACGLVFRYRDENNYYVVRANALEDNVNLYTVKNGRRREIKGFNTKVTSGKWHTLGIEARGDQIQVFFDGAKALEAKDGTFAEAGKVGVWTKADSVTYFDNLTVSGL